MISISDKDALHPRELYALHRLIDSSGVIQATGEGVGVQVRVVESRDSGAELLFQRAGRIPLVFGDGFVEIPRPVLSTVADILTMRPDGPEAPRDKHDRPVSSSNLLVQYKSERVPVVSVLAQQLRRSAISAARERPIFTVPYWPGGALWAAALSHDIDIANFWFAFSSLRILELVSKGEIRRAGKVVGSGARSIITDPIYSAVESMLATLADSGVRSTWFVISESPTPASFAKGDVTYRPGSSRVKKVLRRLRQSGHEIGLHGSMATVRNGGRFHNQKTLLKTVSGVEPVGVRQHFLRRNIDETERAMENAGFLYDSTAGFADRNGFRTGHADVIPLWDDPNSAQLTLNQLPFCWMDRALSKYQGVEDPDVWVEDALELADTCASVNGVWCGIWHPNLSTPMGFPGAEAAYQTLVRGVVDRGAWVAPISDIVNWRVARRSLRVLDVAADGSPVLEWDSAALSKSPHPVHVLDAAGADVTVVMNSLQNNQPVSD